MLERLMLDRMVRALALTAAVSLGAAAAGAQSAAPATTRCPGNPGALGVSRTVELDPAQGARYGNMQYKDVDFLADGEVVLTFDDGPLRPYTKAVLEALSAHCTKATFFMVGRMAVADPEMVKEVARQGHTVATHTWSHRNLKSAGPAKAHAEIELGISAIAKAVGGPISPFFRFPYLADPKESMAYLKMRQVAIFSIDVDSIDFRTRNPADVQRRILAGLAKNRKGILLFHDIQRSTAGALKGLLDELARRNFKIVHIVPKGQAKTLAEYDAEAEQMLAKKKFAAVATPLATRSVVWPISQGTGAATQGETAGTGASGKAKAKVQPTSSEPPPKVAAQAEPEPRPAPAPAAAPAPAPRGRRALEDRSWQERVFEN